jgi:predicted metal-dependent peptidase
MNEIVDIRVTRARSILVTDHAFFGSLVMRMPIVQNTSLKSKTMATDGHATYYHPEYLDEVSEAELLGTFVHELFHCILGHHVRRGDRDHDRWNKACDYVVNPMVLDAGFKLPKFVLLDRRFTGLNAEQVYRFLEDEEQQQEDEQESDESQDSQDSQHEQPSAGDEPDDSEGDDEGDSDQSDEGDEGDSDDEASGAGDGSGDGEALPSGHGDPGHCGEILDAAPEHDKAALSEAEGEWEVAVRQAVNIAKKAGELPGFIKEIINDLADPKTDWREVVQRFVDPSATKDYSWQNPNRRLMSMGYYVPGLISDGVSHVGIAIDASLSVNTGTLRTFGGETQAALDDGRIDKLTQIFFDTRVTASKEYSPGETIDWEIPGRGGTAFSPVFKWFAENAPDIQCLLIFTDMQCSDFGPEPHFPTLWCGYGDPRVLQYYQSKVPFGECVDVNQ